MPVLCWVKIHRTLSNFGSVSMHLMYGAHVQGRKTPRPCMQRSWAFAQVDADPSNGRRAALRSEDEIARLIGRSNIVSKVGLQTASEAPCPCLRAQRPLSSEACATTYGPWNARRCLMYLGGFQSSLCEGMEVSPCVNAGTSWSVV